jgi:ABC-2 type transport system ATP-binding protein
LRPVQGKNVLLLSILYAGADLWGDIALDFPQYQFQASASGQVRIESTEPINIGPLVRLLDERKIQVVEARRHYPSLEDIFVQVTGINAGIMKKEKEKAAGGGSQ